MLRARLATAAVAIPLLLALIFWAPPWALAVVVGTLALLAMVEYVGLAFPAQPRDRVVALVSGTFVIAAAAGGPGPLVICALVTAAALGLSWTVLGRADFEHGLADLGRSLVGVLYVGLLLPHFIWLRELEQGPAWVTLVLAVGMGGDTSGYFVGRAIGRHRLMPRLSPGKTVEGAVAIVAASVLAAAVVKVVLLRGRSWTEMLALGLVLGVLGQLGDLGESVMKRTYGVKESGWMFPGHGGVLDRIDSLLFPVCVVYYYLIICSTF